MDITEDSTEYATDEATNDIWTYTEWMMVSRWTHIESWTTRDANQAARCREGGWEVLERTVTCTAPSWDDPTVKTNK